jgi:tetratricopeptide (TPR) repeat protein
MKHLQTKTLLYLFLIFFISSYTLVHAQVDSLHRLLAKAKVKEDTFLVDMYQQLSLFYNNKFNQVDSANFYTDKGLELATKIAYDKGIARGNMIKSNMYNEKGEIGKAFSAIKKAYDIYTRLGIDREAGQALYGLGTIYLSAGDVNSAVKYFLEASNLLEKDKKNPALSAAYINLGIGLSKLERNKEALDYYEKAIYICQQNKDLPREIMGLVNRVTPLSELNMLDSAWESAEQAYQKSKQINFSIGMIRSLIQKANVALSQKKYAQVLLFSNEIITLSEKYKQQGYWGNAYQKIAIAYDSLRQYDKALENAKKALFYTKEYHVGGANQLQDQAKTLEVLYGIYKHQNNYPLALEHYEKAIILKDSTANQERTFQNNALASLYETQKKEQEIVALNQQTQMQSLQLQQKNTLLIALSGVAILLFLIGFLFYRQRQLKAKQRLSDLEQRLLRSRLNPHFWFNALTSVHSLLLGEQNTRKTAQYLTKIATIMRQSLESTYQDLVPIEQEITFIENYLTIQQMRTDQKFDYEIKTNKDLEISEILIPSMLLQPFVENAIEHGFKNISYQGQITIYFEKKGNTLQISIEDNGKGIGTTTNEKESRHRSRALEITKERLSLLNKKQKNVANVSIENKKTENGVRVVILLPEIGT